MGNQVASTVVDRVVGKRRPGKRISAKPLSSSWNSVKEFKDGADADLNGYSFSNICIPESVLEIILSYIAPDDILSLTQVCTVWKDITTRRSFWKLVFGRCGRGGDWNSIPAHVKEREHSWIVFYAAAKNRFLTRNLVKNPSGNDQFQNWVILRAGGRGGNNFTIESPPIGIDNLPPRERDDFEGLNDTAFATSYDWCSKQQKIDLWEFGLTPAVMQTMLPFEIALSEMVGSRFDCGGMYRIHVCLQNNSNDEITEDNLLEGTRQSGAGWGEITYSLKVDLNEGDGEQLNDIRYFVLTNHGKDNQFWAGHYGIKFSRIAVTVKCLAPREKSVKDEDQVSSLASQLQSTSLASSENTSRPSRPQSSALSHHGLPPACGYHNLFGDMDDDPQSEEDSGEVSQEELD